MNRTLFAKVSYQIQIVFFISVNISYYQNYYDSFKKIYNEDCGFLKEFSPYLESLEKTKALHTQLLSQYPDISDELDPWYDKTQKLRLIFFNYEKYIKQYSHYTQKLQLLQNKQNQQIIQGRPFTEQQKAKLARNEGKFLQSEQEFEQIFKEGMDIMKYLWEEKYNLIKNYTIKIVSFQKQYFENQNSLFQGLNPAKLVEKKRRPSINLEVGDVLGDAQQAVSKQLGAVTGFVSKQKNKALKKLSEAESKVTQGVGKAQSKVAGVAQDQADKQGVVQGMVIGTQIDQANKQINKQKEMVIDQYEKNKDVVLTQVQNVEDQVYVIAEQANQQAIQQQQAIMAYQQQQQQKNMLAQQQQQQQQQTLLAQQQIAQQQAIQQQQQQIALQQIQQQNSISQPNPSQLSQSPPMSSNFPQQQIQSLGQSPTPAWGFNNLPQEQQISQPQMNNNFNNQFNSFNTTTSNSVWFQDDPQLFSQFNNKQINTQPQSQSPQTQQQQQQQQIPERESTNPFDSFI